MVSLETPVGEGELLLDEAAEPVAGLLLGHGAGGGVDSWDLALLAQELPLLGVSVARYRQPWLVAGRRVAGPPASLDRGWQPAVQLIREQWLGLRLFVGGRSAGARAACRCCTPDLAGLVALSFPLHPPGKPEKSRIAELAAVPVPGLVIQGQRDPFGSPAELTAALVAAGVLDKLIVPLASATHSLAPPARFSGAEVRDRADQVVRAVRDFVA